MDKGALSRRLMKIFVGELEGHVQALDRDLLSLESGPTPTAQAEIFRNLFRTGHSLKGSARAVNVAMLETAGHHLESIFAAARDGSLTIEAQLFALLFAATDAIKDVGQRLASGADLSTSPLLALLPKLESTSIAVPPAERAPEIAPKPSVGDSASPPRSVGRKATDTAPVITAEEAFVRIPSARLDRLIALGGELRVARSRTMGRTADLERLLEMTRRWQSESPIAKRGSMHRPGIEETTSSGVTQDALPAARKQTPANEHFGWLSRQLEQLAASLEVDRKALDQVAVPLEEEVMRARMVSFAEACEGFNRVVRDLAKDVGKEIDLAIEGGEIEIDRTVMVAIKDALLHLVRNAVDHGIELPAVRIAAGKATRGRITLSAALRQGWVEIAVADDGRGLDIEAIRAQAAKQRLQLPDDENATARLVFASGFTTSLTVTAISGRGVGLDVVKTAAESLRGTYDIAFEPGRGCRIVLTVPLTLTRLPALLVKAAGQTYAIDSASVCGLRRFDAAELPSMEGRDVLIFEESPVPIFSLAEILGQQEHEVPHAGDKLPAVILEAGTARAAFIVGELLAEQELVVKDLGPRLQHVDNITGATILPNGRIALILNTADLLRSALGQTSSHSLSKTLAELPSAAKKRLLVVDDSVTTRTLVKSILETAGYEVMDAADGMEAWQLLQEKGSDLVVSDVEMPRMDGFALTETIRNSKRFRELPVILVTGMEAEKDKMRGLEAGADAYLLKSAFDQTNLIQAIEQLI